MEEFELYLNQTTLKEGELLSFEENTAIRCRNYGTWLKNTKPLEYTLLKKSWSLGHTKIS